MKTVLGIDNGTQSTKVLFYNYETGAVAAMASSPHDLITKDDGSREQKAEWWISALKKAMDQIDPDIKKTAVAVGVSGQQHGFVPINAEGKVLCDVKLWCDTSTADLCKDITGEYGGFDKLTENSCNPILPGYTASKIAWLKKDHPELYKEMTTVLLPHDYLNFYLTGERVMEYGDASGTGLLNIDKREWQEDLVNTISPDLLGKLPKIIAPDAKAGQITAAAAAEFGIPEGIPVSAGGGDNMMGAIGTGTTKDGVLTISLGTSGTLYGFSKKPILDPEGVLAAFCSSTGGWLPLLCTMNCTVTTELTRSLFEKDVHAFDDIASKVEAGSEGVVILPFFNGERSPNLPNGKGSIMGLDMSNFTMPTLCRASMESAIFGMKGGLNRFKELGFNAKEIRLIGGGANSPLWRQMTADIMELPVLLPKNKESAAMGAAVQALWMKAGGGEEKLDELIDEHIKIDEASKCTPNPEMKPKYDKAYKVYGDYLSELESLYK